MKRSGDYEIEDDGRTVWINGPILLGRFSRTGVDVHIDGQCIGDSCTPGPCVLKDWRMFQYLMLEHHDIDVSDKYRPKYLRDG